MLLHVVLLYFWGHMIRANRIQLQRSVCLAETMALTM